MLLALSAKRSMSICASPSSRSSRSDSSSTSSHEPRSWRRTRSSGMDELNTTNRASPDVTAGARRAHASVLYCARSERVASDLRRARLGRNGEACRSWVDPLVAPASLADKHLSRNWFRRGAALLTFALARRPSRQPRSRRSRRSLPAKSGAQRRYIGRSWRRHSRPQCTRGPFDGESRRERGLPVPRSFAGDVRGYQHRYVPELGET